MTRFRCLFLSLILFLPSVATAVADSFHDIATRDSVTVSVALMEASKDATATVILFSGGNGRLRLNRGQERLNRNVNFLIRSRHLFAAEGFDTISMDVPSDRSDGLTGFRTTEDHAADIAAVIAWARHRVARPVWLVGTSRGTLSAANGAARLGLGGRGPDGIVLTASVTEASKDSKETVYETPYRDIRGPVVVVHHRDDECYVTPLRGARALAEKLKAELIEVSGGLPPRSKPCRAQSAHGFLGIEEDVVGRIADRIRASNAK